MPKNAIEQHAQNGCPPALGSTLSKALQTGKTTTAQEISACGIPASAAIAIAAQVNARAGNAQQLVNAGISAPLAAAMAAKISSSPA